MKALQHMPGEKPSPDGAIHLLLTEGEMMTAADKLSEEVQKDIWSRANEVGSVLENILHEPHHECEWP